MADLSEILANSDPEQLKKLIQMHSDLGGQAPYDAIEAAKASQAADYGNIFSKQLAQDVVDQASIPGKSAAQSAEVFSKAPGLMESSAPAMAGDAGSSMLGGLGRLASKAALPLSAGYEFLKSGPVDEDEDALMEARRGSARGPADYSDVKGLLANSSNMPDYLSKPLNTRELSGDDEDEEAPSRTPASPAEKLKDLVARATGKKPVESRMNTSDAIAQLMGMRQNQLSSAEALRNQLQSNAGYLRTASLGAALAPLAHMKTDEEGYKANMAEAQQPVNDVMTQQALQGQAVKDMSSQQSLKTQLAKSDVNSDISRAADKLARYNAAKLGLTDLIPEGALTANEADDLQKILAQEAARKDMADARALQREQLNAFKESKRDEDRKDKQNKAESEAYQHVLSFRGNAAAQQASKDVLNADKAIALIDRPGMKTTQDLRLIAEEMGKFASGGVPGEHGTEAIMPSNMKTKLAEIKNFLSSHPTDAQADSYLKRNKDYLQDAIQVSKNTLKNYQMSMAKGYKNRLTPEAYKSLMDSIDANYGLPQVKDSPTSTKSIENIIQPHPYDDLAEQWAKNNPGDPRSAQILKLNGVQ